MKKLILFLSITIFVPYISLAQVCFSSVTNFTAGISPFSFTSADFNGDGEVDIASAFNDSGVRGVVILMGNGLGGFSASNSFGIVGHPHAIVSEDFNGDGKIDIAIASQSVNYVSIYFGNGIGGFSTANNFGVVPYPLSMTHADFNGDGNIDLATANSGSNNVSILLGDGLGSFSSPINFGVGSYPESITHADFNGDGNIDLATANYTSKDVSVLLGDGTGSFSAPSDYFVGTYCNYISCADYNGDGNTDIVTSGGGTISVQLGDGLGSFSAAIYYNPTGTIRSITSYDFNSDGKMDIAYVNSTTDEIKIHLGNGLGSFSSTTSFTVGDEPRAILCADFNGDGKMDLASNNRGSNNVSVLLGNVTFTTSQTNVTCSGGSNGTATTSITCGILPIAYSWNTSPIQTTAIATGLSAGTYSITITDAAGATKTSSVIITEPAPLSATTSSFPNTKCSGVCNGSAQVTSVGNGTSPYTYQWGAAANNQTTATASSLCQGYYSVMVKDANLCSVTKNVQVNMIPVADPEIYLTNLAAVDQVNVSPSFASYYTYNLPTSITPPPSNPRNFVDPGKKARFKVECTNNKSNGQSIVSGICKVRSNNPYITITDSSSALNNIGWGNYAWSADEFEVNIDPNTPPGTNAYIDFVVQESGQEYSTTCIAIPITPLVYSPTTTLTIDDDNNPDSQGNDNDICEQGEIIEFNPWLDNISTLDAEYVRGRFENLDNHSFITIWNGVPGINTTVYDAGWWNYAFAQPQTITSNSYDTRPEYDFVFNYGSTTLVNDFNLYMVMAGGFNLFSSSALSLVQWSLPYTFNSAVSIGDELKNKDGLSFYPNPSNDFITIENKSTLLNSTYLIFNSLGQQVLTGKLTHTTTTIDIKQLPTGLYFLQVGENEKQSFKLMKK